MDDAQNQIPIIYCSHCMGEIYKRDVVYNLDEIYDGGKFIVHQDCLTFSLENNKELVLKYIFDDLCRLQDIFDQLLTKFEMWDLIDDWGEDDE